MLIDLVKNMPSQQTLKKQSIAQLSAPTNDLVLRSARGEHTERTPVWLMRQAGRFDPKYLEIRQHCGLELEELFRTPDLAAQITLLPVRLGVDAAILFQDILTPLAPMGAPFVFRPGPTLNKPIRTEGDVAKLRAFDPTKELAFVPRSIELVLDKLANSIPLIGFAGAPFTLAAFLIEGKSPSENLQHTRAMMQDAPQLLHQLLDLLAKVTSEYLLMQIDAGVHLVQLFESVADRLSPAEYEQFAHPYQEAVLRAIPPTCPTILFVKEWPSLDLMVKTGANVLSVGSCIELQEARSLLNGKVALQGNVDNEILRSGSSEEIEEAVRRCVVAGDHTGHILNLNHGILKDTPIDNVCRFIDAAKSLTPEPEPSNNLEDAP